MMSPLWGAYMHSWVCLKPSLDCASPPMLCNCCVSSCTVSERWQEESMCLQYRHECWLQYLSPQCWKSLIQNLQNYCVPVRVQYGTLLFFESGGRSLFFSLGPPIPVSLHSFLLHTGQPAYACSVRGKCQFTVTAPLSPIWCQRTAEGRYSSVVLLRPQERSTGRWWQHWPAALAMLCLLRQEARREDLVFSICQSCWSWWREGGILQAGDALAQSG